jgi:hypothetical protein
MARHLKMIRALLASILMMASIGAVCAANNPALNPDILRLALDWERIKFEVQNPDDQENQMALLAERALQVRNRYQSQPDAAIWLGLIVSEQE